MFFTTCFKKTSVIYWYVSTTTLNPGMKIFRSLIHCLFRKNFMYFYFQSTWYNRKSSNWGRGARSWGGIEREIRKPRLKYNQLAKGRDRRWTVYQNKMRTYTYVHNSVHLLSCVQFFATPWTEACRLLCPSPTPGVYPNSSPLSQGCHPTISSSLVPFFSRLQSFQASGSFQMSQLFASGGQSTGVSASASVLPMNSQDSFTMEFKGFSRVFFNTTVQKHQFFSAQVSL